jgi:hypothetical protein
MVVVECDRALPTELKESVRIPLALVVILQNQPGTHCARHTVKARFEAFHSGLEATRGATHVKVDGRFVTTWSTTEVKNLRGQLQL